VGLEVSTPPTFPVDIEGTASKVNAVPSGGYSYAVTCSLNRTVNGDLGSATESVNR